MPKNTKKLKLSGKRNKKYKKNNKHIKNNHNHHNHNPTSPRTNKRTKKNKNTNKNTNDTNDTHNNIKKDLYIKDDRKEDVKEDVKEVKNMKGGNSGNTNEKFEVMDINNFDYKSINLSKYINANNSGWGIGPPPTDCCIM